MSFIIYCIICTVIAGVYFAVNIAMDITGKNKKKKESVEEFNTASMGDEGSVVIEETSPDGEYNVVQGETDPSDDDNGQQQGEEQQEVSEPDNGQADSTQVNEDGQYGGGSDCNEEQTSVVEQNQDQDNIPSPDQLQDENLNYGLAVLNSINEQKMNSDMGYDYQYQQQFVSGNYNPAEISHRSIVRQNNIIKSFPDHI